MDKEELQRVLENHRHYLCGGVDGWYWMRADLHKADLERTNLEYAILNSAILDKEEEYRRGVVLTESIRGWKKCADDSHVEVMVELEIPKWSVVFCINGNKCRTNRARVLSISRGDVAHSTYDFSFTYEVGQEIVIDDFDMSYNVECASGIHFFKDREDAENY